MQIDEQKKQQAIVKTIENVGKCPDPTMPISSFMFTVEVLTDLYREAFEAGYRQKEADLIISTLKNL